MNSVKNEHDVDIIFVYSFFMNTVSQNFAQN